MKKAKSNEKYYQNGDETYGNQFVNPVINFHLRDCIQYVEKNDYMERTVSICLDANGDEIGILTAVWSLMEGEIHVFAYELDTTNQNTCSKRGINDIAECELASFIDIQNEEQAEEYEVAEFMPKARDYWNQQHSENFSLNPNDNQAMDEVCMIPEPINEAVSYCNEMKSLILSVCEDVSDSSSMTEAWKKVERCYYDLEVMRNRIKTTSTKSFGINDGDVDGHTKYLQGIHLPIMVNAIEAEDGTLKPSAVSEMHIGNVDGQLAVLITPENISLAY